MKRVSIFLFSLIVLVSSCKKDSEDEPTDYSGQRSSTVNHISSQIIVKNYDQLKIELESLQSAFESFMQDSSSTSIANLKFAMTAVAEHWQHVSPFEFGPAADVALRGTFNTFPCDTAKVNQAILEENTQFDQLGMSDAIGLPALDYLFFEKSILELQHAYFTHGLASQREDYTRALIAHMLEKLDLVILGWSAQGDNYLSTFQNSTGTDVGSALGILVNSFNQHFERYFRDGKIGIPLGIRSLGIALPEKVESLYAQQSMFLANQNLLAIENVYLGRFDRIDGEGLDDYLTTIGSTDLHQSIVNQFSVIHDCLGNVKDPLADRVIDHKATLEACYEEIQKMVVLFKVDMPSRMGILITYQDNDGD